MIRLKGTDTVTGQHRTLLVGERPVDDGENDAATSLIATIASTVIDFDGAGVQKLDTNGAESFSAIGQDATIAKGVTVIIDAIGTDNTVFTFDSDWRWLGLVPTSLETGERGVLSLISVGDGVNDIIASYEQVGLG